MHSQGSLPSDSSSIASNPLPYFIAMTESIDHEIGRLMDSLSSSDLNNTIIIFIGDNGTSGQVIQAPYSTGQAKGSLYQGGIHVPMIISGKGVSRMNEREGGLICGTDLFSTISAIAGADVSSYESSTSFKAALTSSGQLSRKYNYSDVLSNSPNKSGFTIRDSRYKLIQFDNGRKEFYDLITDPYEGDNLISGSLSTEEQNALDELEIKAAEIRS